jgi:2-polyprenyl-3-methyl-5-hydroxy-6-metoxy-1,4-benzoquinol methylase
MEPIRYDEKVREQYEALPYPARSPDDEPSRLCTTWLDELPMINHYCFRGRRDFRGAFRSLVAGGGTGDGTLYLAEQLRDTGAEVVHLDVSAKSMDIAKKRAMRRGLRNIAWVHASILDLSRLGLGRFDYINCSGVLHHLERPDEGLAVLESVLADDGALGVMVYGKYGRTAVYQMQELFRLVDGGDGDRQARIARARALLASLPPTSWWKRGEKQDQQWADEMDDAEIYDLFLHSRDRAYTVPELCEWIERGHGLHLRFTDPLRGHSPYRVEKYISSAQSALLDRIKSLGNREQEAIAEIIGGDIYTHTFYATRQPDSAASPEDLDNVPFFFHDPVTGPFFYDQLDRSTKDPLVLAHEHSGATVRIPRGRYVKHVFQHINGERTLREIFERVRSECAAHGAAPSDHSLVNEFGAAFDELNAIDTLLLRHKSVPRYKSIAELHAQMKAPSLR